MEAETGQGRGRFQKMSGFWLEIGNEMVYLGDIPLGGWLKASNQLKSQLMGYSDDSQTAHGAELCAEAELPNRRVENP